MISRRSAKLAIAMNWAINELVTFELKDPSESVAFADLVREKLKLKGIWSGKDTSRTKCLHVAMSFTTRAKSQGAAYKINIAGARINPARLPSGTQEETRLKSAQILCIRLTPLRMRITRREREVVRLKVERSWWPATAAAGPAVLATTV